MKPIEFERELALHSESTIRAIESGRVDLAKRRLAAYPRFATAFLEAATNRGVFFSDESAPSASILDWPTPLQIARYAQKGAIAAVSTQNLELIREGAYLPLRFLELSITHRDFLFYQEMSRIYPRFLSLAYESTVSSTRQQVIEMSWRPISDFCRYQFAPLLRDHATDKAPSYISQTLWVMSDLMDMAMAHSDHEAFSLMGRELDRLFDTFAFHRLPNDDLQLMLEVEHNERMQIWFGLGAWATRSSVVVEENTMSTHQERPPFEDSQIHRFFDETARRFNSLDGLSTAYFASLHLHSRGALWRRWVRDSLADGRPRRDIFDRLLDRFYCLTGVRLVMAGENDPIRPHREAQFRREGIETFLREVVRSPHTWGDFLPAVETAVMSENTAISLEEAIQSLSDLYYSSIQRWEYLREEQILQAPLDSHRVHSFQEDCFSAWQQNCWVEVLFRGISKLRTEPAESRTAPSEKDVTIVSLVPKDAFVADQDALFFGLGQSAGARLAGEVIDEFLSLLDSSCEKLAPANAEKATSEVLARLSGMAYPVVIVVGNIDSQFAISEHKDFAPSWSDDRSEFLSGNFIGRLNNAPVFHIFEDAVSEVLIVDMQKLGTLVHYLPPPQYDHRGLEILVNLISENDAEDLDRKYPHLKPDSLSDALGPDGKNEEMLRWFMLQAYASVGVKLEWEELDTRPGVVIPLTPA